MSAIAANLARVRDRIARAAEACGRDPDAIRLIAVSKKKSVDAIREAYDAGQRAFGESYAQELATKADALAELEGIAWHFIGHLQSNKAKLVAPRVAMVHAIDGAFVGRELAKRAERAERTAPIPILVEVNVGGEPQKHGVSPSDLEPTLRALREVPALDVRGLMTMPPEGDLSVARSVFEALASLRNLHGGREALPELSMGMSGDLEEAVRAGATFVRIGTSIFGDR